MCKLIDDDNNFVNIGDKPMELYLPIKNNINSIKNINTWI